jgi:hypothetical protein
MILKIFAIFDMKGSYYLPPFFLKSNGEAIRAFADMVNTDGHQLNKHSADYVLFEIGIFNEENGHIIPSSAPINLGVGVEFLRMPISPVARPFVHDVDGSDKAV